MINMESPLEAIEFLARSGNRVMVLDTLTNGPSERYDLEEMTGVSRATLGRILEDFEARGWVSRDGRQYETTQVGDFVAREFTTLLGRMGTAQELAALVQWFPDDGYGFDIKCLESATITRVEKSDTIAPIMRMVQRIDAASRVQVLSYAVNQPVFETHRKAIREGRQSLAAVIDDGVRDVIAANAEMANHAANMLKSEDASFFYYPDDIPYILVITDDTVNLGLADEDGAPKAVIHSDHPDVRAWAEATFTEYRDAAEPIDSAMFTP